MAVFLIENKEDTWPFFCLRIRKINGRFFFGLRIIKIHGCFFGLRLIRINGRFFD